MNFRNISHFEGLKTTLGRGKAQLFTLLDSKNIRTHSGEAELRKGQLYIYDTAHELPGPIHSVYQYSRDGIRFVGGNPTNIIYREYIVSIWDDTLSRYDYYGWDGDLASTIDMINEDGSAVRISITSDDLWAAQYMDWMWLANGKDALYKYDAVNFYRAGIEAPTVAPVCTRTANSSSGKTDSPFYRKYKYRYIRIERDADGIYEYAASPFSPETICEDFDGNTMLVTMTLSTDEQVNYIELYGTLSGDNATGQDLDGATYYRIDADEGSGHLTGYSGIDNTGAGTHEDNHPDGHLDGLSFIFAEAELWDSSFDVPYTFYHPELTDSHSWRNPPEQILYPTMYKDRMYAVTADNRSVPIYSDLAEPESWDQDNWIDVLKEGGGMVTGFVAFHNSLIIFKDNAIWSMTGDPDASPVFTALSGGERVPQQTEIGVGCTAPRSIATYGEDLIIFYSSRHGLYRIQNGQILVVSDGINMLGLDNESAGSFYVDHEGEVFYVLSPPTGDAWVVHIKTGYINKDDNVNIDCFCIDHQGWLLCGTGGFIDRFYHPDQEDDNGADYLGYLKTAWVNLRHGEMDAVIRGIQLQYDAIWNGVLIGIKNERGNFFEVVMADNERYASVNGISGRLFSVELNWKSGIMESLTFKYKRRRRHFR